MQTAQATVQEALNTLEVRLERLLASGWRSSSEDRLALRDLADQLVALGFDELTARVRAVADADEAREGLARVALARATCRILQARLGQTRSDDQFEVESPSTNGAGAPVVRLLLVSRLLVEGEARWVTVRIQRGVATDLVLVVPTVADEPPAMETPVDGGLAGRLIRRARAAADALGGQNGPRAASDAWWLRAQLESSLRWKARIPLGGSAEVDLCSATVGSTPASPADGRGPAFGFRAALDKGHVPENFPIVQGGPLRIRQVSTEDLDSYVWLDPTARETFRRAAGAQAWAISWGEGGLITPLALVAPRRALHASELIHLVPGAPSVPITP